MGEKGKDPEPEPDPWDQMITEPYPDPEDLWWDSECGRRLGTSWCTASSWSTPPEERPLSQPSGRKLRFSPAIYFDLQLCESCVVEKLCIESVGI